MFINMLLAHFVADYVLQPNTLAKWKASSAYGVLAHGIIVTIVTMGFAIQQLDWLLWALLIGVFHTLIDLIQFKLQSDNKLSFLTPLNIFILDQVFHFVVIMGAIYLSGECIQIDCLIERVQDGGFWTVVLGYVLVSMPAWVMIEFLISGIVLGQDPDFGYASQIKYSYIVERLVLVTFVLFGQYVIILLVVSLLILQHMVIKVHTSSTNGFVQRSGTGLIIEAMSSISIALVIGFTLRAAIF